MLRYLLKHFVFVLVLTLILIGGVVFLIYTEPGLRVSYLMVSKVISGDIEITNLRGKLVGPIYVDKIFYGDKDINISAEQLQLDWNFKDLLRRQFNINRFYAQNVFIKKLNNPVTSGKSAYKTKVSFTDILQQLPRQLKAKDVKLENITLATPSSILLHLDSFNLQSAIDDKDIVHLIAMARAADAFVKLRGVVQQTWDVNWHAHLPKLQQFLGEANGSLEFNGKIIGQRQLPQIEAQLTANNFRYQKITFSKFISAVNLDLSLKRPSHFTLLLDNLQANTLKCNKINLSGDVGKITKNVNISLNLAPTTIDFSLHDLIHELKITGIKSHGILKGSSFNTQTQINIADLEPIHIDLQLPKAQYKPANFMKQDIVGKITWHTRNLAMLQSLLPQINSIQGNLAVNYSVRGTFSQPKLTGKLLLQNASCNIPDLNVALNGVEFSADSVGNKIRYSGKAASGEGTLNLTGETIWSPKEVTHKINLNTTNFLAYNTNEYNIIATSQLNLVGRSDHYELGGSIFIPRAIIQPLNLNGPAGLPPEVVFVTKNPVQEVTIFPLYSKLEITLGDAVYFNAMDLKGKLLGKVQISDAPDKLTNGTGNLIIKDGTYNMYGQPLKVTTGALHFIGGSVTNPQMNLEAVREFKGSGASMPLSGAGQALTVGVRAQGMLDSLNISLFSVPAGMSQQDILSYLVLGQPSAQASGASAQLLMKAATAMNFGGSGEITHVVDKLRQQLGLEEFGLATETTGAAPTTIAPMQATVAAKPTSSLATNTAFVLGKFLTPKIYIGYSVGILNPVNVFRVKYFINRHWSVQSETSSLGNGADIFYSIEHK